LLLCYHCSDALVAIDVFCLSLLSYHYNNTLVATELHVVVVTYKLLPQCLITVVIIHLKKRIEVP
jgi:hypothetical protein